MNRYKIIFMAKRIGAIGLSQRFVEERIAATVNAAVLALYDEFEHVHSPSVVLVEKLS